MKQRMKIILPLILLALVIAAFELDVAYYQMHSDAGLFSELVSLLAGVYGLVSGLKRHKEMHWGGFAANMVLLAVCIGVYALARQIPFCTECDHRCVESPFLRFFLWNEKMWYMD